MPPGISRVSCVVSRLPSLVRSDREPTVVPHKVQETVGAGLVYELETSSWGSQSYEGNSGLNGGDK